MPIRLLRTNPRPSTLNYPPGWGPTFRWADAYTFPDDDYPRVPITSEDVMAIERNDRVIIIGKFPGQNDWRVTLLYPGNTGYHQWDYPAVLTHQRVLNNAADQVDSWAAAGLIP